MESNRLKTFGNRLKTLRRSQGLNQTQFAKKVQLTQAAISQLEDGKRMPSSTALQKIAIGVGLSIDELLREPESVSNEPEKDVAIQALVTKLRKESVSTEAIIALNHFIFALSES